MNISKMCADFLISLKVLLDNGASANTTDNSGGTALMLAAVTGHLKIVQVNLLEQFSLILRKYYPLVNVILTAITI